MNTISYTAQRAVIQAKRSYEQVIQAIEQQVGRVDFAELEKIIAAQAPLEAVADAFCGSSTFMYLAKIDQGRILSLSGNKKKCTLYVLGNPLIGSQMHDVTTSVGLYFPFRLSAYEDKQGAVFVAYDVPSSLVQQHKEERVTALARRFDEQLETLARAVAAA